MLRLSQNLPAGTGDAVGVIVPVIAAAGGAVLILRLLGRMSARQTLLQTARRTTDRASWKPCFEEERSSLDPYGKPQADKWAKEIQYFIEQRIRPSLSGQQQAALGRAYEQVAGVVEARVDEAIRDQPPFKIFSDDMTPAEFETFCAKE